MANLIVEYQRRHKTDSIPVCHNGLCFFNDADGKPALVALTSLACRCFSSCPVCNDKDTPSVIIELFYPDTGGSFSQAAHDHVSPETDLLKYVVAQGHKCYTPFVARNIRDLECWLWQFATQSLKLRAMKPVAGEDPSLKVAEQITHAAIKQPKMFNAYYLAYEAFILSRKYLLFE